MGEPEGEPGAPPGTLAPQCDPAEANWVPDAPAPAPMSPIATGEVAVIEAELEEDKGDATLAGGDGDKSAVPEVAVGGEKEGVGGVAGDGGLSVKEAEVAEALEGGNVEVEVESSAVGVSQPVETEPLPEDVVAGTGEVVKEEGSQMDHAVRREEAFSGDDDDQTKLPVDEEGSAVEAGPIEEVPVAGSDDTMPKEEDKEEQEDLMDETERKGEDVIETEEAASCMDQETVCLDTNNKEADEVELEDNSSAQAEGIGVEVPVHDDPDGDKAMDENLMKDGDGDKVMEENLPEDVDGDKVMDENLPEGVDGDKVMDEDIAPDEDDNKAVNEPSVGVDGDELDDDEDAGDKADKHEQDVMDTNDGEEDEDEDDPPPLPAKKGGSGKKKRPRPTRIKKGEEELCFICFDGGELVVCDRRLEYQTASLCLTCYFL